MKVFLDTVWFFLLQDPKIYGKMFCSKNINSNYSSRQLKCSLTTMLKISQQTSETFGTIRHLSINRFIFDPKNNFPPKGTLDTWIVFLTPHPPCWKDLQKSEILLVQGPKKTQEHFSRKRFFWWNLLWKARPAEKLPPKLSNFFYRISKNKFARFVRSKKLKTSFVSENESGFGVRGM